MNAWVAVPKWLVWPDVLRGLPRRRCPCPLRSSPRSTGPVDVIADARVPPAAQRLRKNASAGPVGVIAEAQVPPAAQPLRNDDSSAVTVCWERSQVRLGATLVRAGLLIGPPRLVWSAGE
jgi:hypothetical protein